MSAIKCGLRLVLFACAAFVAPVAWAASCGVAATAVAFGSYVSPAGSTVDSSGTVSVTCTPDKILLVCSTNYTIALSAGGSVLVYSPRRMAGGGYTLDYNLYSNASRTTIWGDGTGGTSVVADTITTSVLGLVCLPGTKNTTVFGRIPAWMGLSPV